MNNDIYKLIYLIQTKNDLNRKRRRFYYYINPGTYTVKCDGNPKTCPAKTNPLDWSHDCRGFHYVRDERKKHISKKYAQKGYRKAQSEMKAMTAEIRTLWMELGAQIRWGASGMVQQVKYKGEWIRHQEFEYYRRQAIERAQVDNIILGE